MTEPTHAVAVSWSFVESHTGHRLSFVGCIGDDLTLWCLDCHEGLAANDYGKVLPRSDRGNGEAHD